MLNNKPLSLKLSASGGLRPQTFTGVYLWTPLGDFRPRPLLAESKNIFKLYYAIILFRNQLNRQVLKLSVKTRRPIM